MTARSRGMVLIGMLALTTTGCGTSPPPSPSLTGSPHAGSTSATSGSSGPSAGACTAPAAGAIPDHLDADYATALAFAPDGRLFYSERSGTVRVWQAGGSHQFASVSTVTTEPGGGYSERGLLGLAISPTFPQDHFVFAFYSDADRVHQHVVRWRDCAGRGTEETTIITLPSGPDCCHKGGRLGVGPDRTLYVTLGDQHTATSAQDTADPRGKVLRYTLDGGVPADNPFGAGNPVFASGLRNPFGIAISPSGQIAVTNNGPSGDAGSPSTGFDTVLTTVRPGAEFQWPLCYGYSHPLAPATSCGSGRQPPDWSSESSTVVPTGATFVDAAGPPAYAGHLVFCTFASGMLVLTPGVPQATVTRGPAGCRLDVKEAPDHALYVSNPTQITRVG